MWGGIMLTGVPGVQTLTVACREGGSRSPQSCLWASSESTPPSPSSWATFLTNANSAKIEVEEIKLSPVREMVFPGTLWGASLLQSQGFSLEGWCVWMWGSGEGNLNHQPLS